MPTEIYPNYYGPVQERKGQNLYELWEKGIPFGDSITPSGFSPQYISRIMAIITANTPKGARIVSLGSGNGFIEERLMKAGYQVVCVDCNEEAVAITTRKGLESICADFFELSPHILKDAATIYADGFFGHLYDSCSGLTRSLHHLQALHLDDNAKIIVSNDAPIKEGADVEPHGSVPNFSYLSSEYLRKQFKKIGIDELRSEIFEYHRPISGIRKRTIYVGILNR
ncbi:class I SAM-dependent methyltransferase [Pantoea allii]|uniref:class I SAM-dependent methyltransferase n=1 Tax=Pantoea TaxID=53335 RepID=UPI0007C8060E|nr:MULTISPECIES: hypothetical protein [Pantoea]MBW1254003.1 hypothetical protein [Pantoea allii]MBW1263046.1 hypothetical protein [Pantoea allii]MBW1284913.1 hypothetical protein [Pantoea allii]OAE03970.1 hypothetical protein A6A26_23380 [Pantoea sp. OXWO6B1]ORM88434.1 hypothetical protein HA38_04110 [Pantoea allii]